MAPSDPVHQLPRRMSLPNSDRQSDDGHVMGRKIVRQMGEAVLISKSLRDIVDLKVPQTGIMEALALRQGLD